MDNILKLVSVELGKSLKELGFKVTWLKDHYNISDGRQYGIWVGGGELYEYDDDNHIGLPSLELAKQWFRVKHNIHIVLDYGDLSEKWMFTVYDITKPACKQIFSSDMEYTSYEKALEVGLLKACETIKEQNYE